MDGVLISRSSYFKPSAKGLSLLLRELPVPQSGSRGAGRLEMNPEPQFSLFTSCTSMVKRNPLRDSAAKTISETSPTFSYGHKIDKIHNLDFPGRAVFW